VKGLDIMTVKEWIKGMSHDYDGNKEDIIFKHVLTDLPLYTGNYEIGSQLLLPSNLIQREILSILFKEYENLTGIKTDEEYTVHLLDIQNIIDFERLDRFQQQYLLSIKKIESPLSHAKRIMATGRPNKEIALIVASSRNVFEEVNDDMFKFQMKAECVFIGKEILV